MSEIKVDTVAEKTSANGVTVDGLNIKDSKLVTANSVIETNLTDNIVTLAKMASGTDGNIISYDASGNPVAIATGSDGQVLTSTGAGSPPAFETPAAGGKLLQVVTNTHATRFATSSTSYVAATGYTIAITPSATSSKVYVVMNAHADNGASGRNMKATIYRGSTILSNADGFNTTLSSGARVYAPLSMSVLDSPNTSSAVTYQVYVKAYGGAISYNDAEGTATMTAFEIAG